MTITESNFIELALAEVPELRAVVKEHFDTLDELLIHLLIADTRRFLVSAFEAGEHEVVVRGLAFLGRALSNGDENVNNAVAVSFVEDGCDTPPQFIALWSAELQDERDRQQDWWAQRDPLDSPD